MRYLLFVLTLSTAHIACALPAFSGLLAGAITQDNLPYKNVSTKTNPSLLVLGRWGDLFIEGNRVGYPLMRFDGGTLSAMGQVRMHQYLDASDSALIETDRERALELGAQLSVPLGGRFFGQFSVLQDISGGHKGQEYEASIYKRVDVGSVRLVTTVALQYQSKALVDYYVGTDDYRPESDWVGELELLATWPFANDWALVAVGRFYQHGDELNNSPLTNSAQTHRVAVGVGHYF
jgi:outer membrane scaffolding protein for murein synthesis (MipA/OmpV family)